MKEINTWYLFTAETQFKFSLNETMNLQQQQLFDRQQFESSNGGSLSKDDVFVVEATVKTVKKTCQHGEDLDHLCQEGEGAGEVKF